MKKIEAIIRQERFHLIKIALEQAGFTNMTVSDVMGRGKQKGIALKWRHGSHLVEFLPKKKIEIVVDDRDYRTVMDIICDRGFTGTIGDGKIFVMPVEEVVRIRTREEGPDAI